MLQYNLSNVVTFYKGMEKKNMLQARKKSAQKIQNGIQFRRGVFPKQSNIIFSICSLSIIKVEEVDIARFCNRFRFGSWL